MPDVVVRLRFNYFQRYEPKRSRKGKIMEVCLSDMVDLAIQKVDPKFAPVAYRVRTVGDTLLGKRCVDAYEIRNYDNRLWWPLLGANGPIDPATFKELAAVGHPTPSSLFNPETILPFIDAPSADAYFDRHPARELHGSNSGEQLARVQRAATGIMFCGDSVLVEAGEPIWFAQTSPLEDCVEFRIGCSSLDRTGSIDHDLPGPSVGWRRSLGSDGRAFDLAEFESQKERLLGEIKNRSVSSRIETWSGPQPIDTGARFCQRALVRLLVHRTRERASIWWPLREKLPTLDRMRGPEDCTKDSDCRDVLLEFVEVDDIDGMFGVATARDIIRRNHSFQNRTLSAEDDDFLASLGP